ncbi:hypothetical protein [Spirosoma areae]
MQKRIIPFGPEIPLPSAASWLNIEQLARVELSSESGAYPIESALSLGTAWGWRAAHAGKQVIRLVFDQPLTLRRIYLLFEETQASRTQEFTLDWSTEAGSPLSHIVRQQYTFSPPGTIREVEDYQVDLAEVKLLQVTIIPSLSGGLSYASLKALRLGSFATGYR